MSTESRQRALDFAPRILPPVVDQRVPQREVPRLYRMSLAILERLLQGPATNTELAQMFRPGAAWRTRLSDVRLHLQQQGETVAARDLGEGLWVYEIRMGEA